MKVVLLDTAGPVIGAAAWDDGALVGSASIRIVNGADAWLTPTLAELVEALGGLDRIGVSVGPGAFTGIRVGVATALGLALSRGVGVVPVSSLKLRATLAPGRARVLALLDARKGKVYAGLFDTRGAIPIALSAEADLPPTEAAASPPAVAVGEGALVFADMLVAHGHEVCAEAGESPVTRGRSLVEGGVAMDCGEVALRYLREADARPPGV